MLTHFTHPAPIEIFNALCPAIPTLSKATVYNTLKLLAKQGAITEIDIDEKNMRYDGDIRPHAHFICKCCQKIHDLPLRAVAAEAAGGCLIQEQQVYCKGYCQVCRINNDFEYNY